ncbi:MAG: acyl--CoA ligase [Sulfurimonas sp.]|uniref:class I adenylate-forming enzyme family protein n=1 Tax=Sulfurimonas sp. TaxID=2022749 RepID=UPI0025F3082B|nr:class I adenylate-forming enzyme family protein [Sulfurimonas sp.]MCK9492011.1 acyl--CoA ligase [Sulfurimonas sp.]
MILEYINLDGSKELIDLEKSVTISPHWDYIQTTNKLDFIKTFIPKYLSGQKIVLFDANHKQLLDFYNNNNINELKSIDKANKNSKILFFTSGSSGFPVGAFKSEDNLLLEVESLKKILANRDIKRVVVSVPFVHIYGILAGLLLPIKLDCVTLVVKEDFLPYELLEEALKEDTLVITTPVFIKAMAKLPESKDLSHALFVSSTAPLALEDVAIFEDKYSSNIVQLFGSTETGGIAYKKGRSAEWNTLPYVKIQSSDDKLSVRSPFISNYILNSEIIELIQPYITEDIVEIKDKTFTLIGRSNKLIKIAGKRISATLIENILEEIPEINKAIVSLVYKKELLRSEQILITLEASGEVSKRLIKEKISQYYGIITIPFNLKYVDKINNSAMGKKVIFN